MLVTAGHVMSSFTFTWLNLGSSQPWNKSVSEKVFCVRCKTTHAAAT